MIVLLQHVPTDSRNFEDYKNVIEDELFNDILELAKKLKDKKVLYINSNQNRGGVYEHLTSIVPILQSLGINVEWKAITKVPPDFYEVTKRIYNSIQGVNYNFTTKEWGSYESFNKKIAKEIGGETWDYVLVQDHQLMGSLYQMGDRKGKTKWIWQSHSETHNPEKKFLAQMKKYLQPYDGIIFYLPEYIFKNFDNPNVITSTIAIDPLSHKNRNMTRVEAKKIVKKFGINPNQPLITQISRVDSWKDFPGVVDAWLIAKQKHPNLQLALVGIVSANNVHAQSIIDLVNEKVKDEKNAHILINIVERDEIKAFQVASNVIIQKSLREGFGLTVSEALWSSTPVIGGNVGGIKVQIIDGKSGYLVNNVNDCAKYIIELIGNPDKARKMGKTGRLYIKKGFLLPRLIRDEMLLMINIS